ncbi:MAG: enoyl-CoA hydratase/isomerase family protein [Pseudomonadales bacterium]|jgi:enoyl-CoA hydratase/carnithine racemase|nr:enoyl-CoA hydratase/isomerase family protein [Pseudomonadales bacterium]
MIDEELLNDVNAPVVLAEWATASGRRLGVVTLNVPKTLNSLNLGMIDLMDAQLRRWAGDAGVVGVYLRGAGDRAFCAGGDIQALYHAMKANHDAGELVDCYAEAFFQNEYRLDHLIHAYGKPVICFGHGACMGGGLGLLSASSHRIVTETSRVAMPEITIGLFPDAGGTALLSSMPGCLGLFLGLTGAHINGADALEAGLGRYLLTNARREALEQGLVSAPWSGERAEDDVMLDALLAELDAASRDARPASKLAGHRAAIDAALGAVDGDFARALAGIRSLAGTDDWIDKGLANLEKGCPATAGIVVEQLHRAQGMSLADMFRMEMVIGTHCARNRDFAEGVRALLIDKDGAPAWTVDGLDALPRETVLAHFEAPWDENPLNDLRD